MRAGFTLMETLIVIALLAVLLTVGQLVSSQYLARQALWTSADTVASELRFAQMDAFTQAGDAPHGIKVMPGIVTRFQGASYTTRNQALDASTSFPDTLGVTGQDEIVIEKGMLGPVANATVAIEGNEQAFDIEITRYGVITVSPRTIGN